jgi:hypothetical protein
MPKRTKQLGKRNLALKYGEAKKRLWQSERTGDSDLQLEILLLLLREDRVVCGKSAELSLEILALFLGRIRRGGAESIGPVGASARCNFLFPCSVCLNTISTSQNSESVISCSVCMIALRHSASVIPSTFASPSRASSSLTCPPFRNDKKKQKKQKSKCGHYYSSTVLVIRTCKDDPVKFGMPG